MHWLWSIIASSSLNASSLAFSNHLPLLIIFLHDGIEVCLEEAIEHSLHKVGVLLAPGQLEEEGEHQGDIVGSLLLGIEVEGREGEEFQLNTAGGEGFEVFQDGN